MLSANLHKAAGIEPDNRLPTRTNASRLVRLPSDDGIVPDNRLSGNRNSTTLPAVSVVTPCHWSSGASVFQFVSSVQFAPPAAS